MELLLIVLKMCLYVNNVETLVTPMIVTCVGKILPSLQTRRGGKNST